MKVFEQHSPSPQLCLPPQSLVESMPVLGHQTVEYDGEVHKPKEEQMWPAKIKQQNSYSMNSQT